MKFNFPSSALMTRPFIGYVIGLAIKRQPHSRFTGKNLTAKQRKPKGFLGTFLLVAGSIITLFIYLFFC